MNNKNNTEFTLTVSSGCCTTLADIAKISDYIKQPIILPQIEKVIYQKTRTIVVWADDTRTIVNCHEEDFDKEKGLAMAIAKKMMKRNEFKRFIDNASYQDV